MGESGWVGLLLLHSVGTVSFQGVSCSRKLHFRSDFGFTLRASAESGDSIWNSCIDTIAPAAPLIWELMLVIVIEMRVSEHVLSLSVWGATSSSLPGRTSHSLQKTSQVDSDSQRRGNSSEHKEPWVSWDAGQGCILTLPGKLNYLCPFPILHWTRTVQTTVQTFDFKLISSWYFFI